MMRKAARLELDEWLAKLRKLAAEERVVMSAHAEEMMLERGITNRQVIRCLQRGRIGEGPARETTGKIRASFEMVDSGEIIRVAAEVYESGISYVAVVTAIVVGR